MSEPLTFVCWRWLPKGTYRSKFGPETVRVLRNMLARHYHKPARFLCVTDHPEEIDRDIETMPLWKEWGDVPSPYGIHQPSCYRRLRAFAPQAAQWFGPRFVSIDLDTVIVRDVTPLFDRHEDFVCWKEQDPRSYYNGSLWMLKAGSRPQVFEQFRPLESPTVAKKDGKFGSDQGWISYILGPNEAKWTQRDGIYSFRMDLKCGRAPLPSDARLVAFHGGQDPWGSLAQRIPWIKQAYR